MQKCEAYDCIKSLKCNYSVKTCAFKLANLNINFIGLDCCKIGHNFTQKRLIRDLIGDDAHYFIVALHLKHYQIGSIHFHCIFLRTEVEITQHCDINDTSNYRAC